VTLVDTNVLIDVISRDRNWFAWSAKTLKARSDLGSLLINDTVYSELSARFDSETLLDETVSTMDLKFERLPKRALFVAGRTFAIYRSAGGPRSNVLADFFIGAHAQVANLPILTRDIRRYKSYFPDVALIAPE
jgi:predicted nucleic acid-binding protein